jgi:hypothetical protein
MKRKKILIGTEKRKVQKKERMYMKIGNRNGCHVQWEKKEKTIDKENGLLRDEGDG